MTASTTAQTYTTREVAEALRLSPRAVRKAIKAGKLAAVNVGAGRDRPVYRVPADALAAFLEARQVA